MAVVQSVVAYLIGSGNTGVNVLHFGNEIPSSPDQTDIDDLNDRIHAAYSAIAGVLVNTMQVIVTPEFFVLDETTGELQAVMAPTEAAATVTGTAQANMSRATQANLRIYTSGIRYGRRVRGRAFLGPLGNAAMDTAGNVETADRNTIDAAFEDLVVPSWGLGVYCRRRPGTPSFFPGEFFLATSVETQATPAVLRSRRT